MIDWIPIGTRPLRGAGAPLTIEFASSPNEPPLNGNLLEAIS